MRKLVLLVVASLVLSTVSLSVEARTRLTKAEVQNTFVGAPWKGPRGIFLFKRNGTYTYSEKRFNRTKTFGPWRYSITSDGTIRGNTTRYQFYRTKRGGYEYYHTRSGRYFRARP